MSHKLNQSKVSEWMIFNNLWEVLSWSRNFNIKFKFNLILNLKDEDPKLLCVPLSVLYPPCGKSIFPHIQPEPLKSQLIIVLHYSDIHVLFYSNPHPFRKWRIKIKWNCKSIFTLSCNFPSPIRSCAYILSSNSTLELNMNLYRLRYICIETMLVTAALKR